jgi:hypothetical protein
MCHRIAINNAGGSAEEGGLGPAGRVMLEPGQRGLTHKNPCAIASGTPETALKR